MLVRSQASLLVIRRANQPGYGKLALPGGFQMRGETWQQAGTRELAEETGGVIDPGGISQIGETVTDETSGNNLIFASYRGPLRFDPSVQKEGETLEVQWLSSVEDEGDWAFPRHCAAAMAELQNGEPR